MSYLSVPSLKSARLVAPLWGQEGAKLLQKKTIANFDFGPGCMYNKPFDSMRFFRYQAEMKHIPITSWKMTVPGFNSGMRRPKERGKEKYLHDLHRLLSSEATQNIKELKLCGPITKWTNSILLNILSQLQHNLQTLTLDDWYFTNNDATLIVPFPPLDKIHFKKLTHFTFS